MSVTPRHCCRRIVCVSLLSFIPWHPIKSVSVVFRQSDSFLETFDKIWVADEVSAHRDSVAVTSFDESPDIGVVPASCTYQGCRAHYLAEGRETNV